MTRPFRLLRRLGTVRASRKKKLGGLIAEVDGSEVSIILRVVLFDQDGRQWGHCWNIFNRVGWTIGKGRRWEFNESSVRFFNVHNRISAGNTTACFHRPQLSSTQPANAPSIGAMTVDATSIVCMTVWWQINNCSLPQKSTHNFINTKRWCWSFKFECF